MNEIHNSKNVVTAASIYAEENVIVGDGNTIINLKEAAQYKAIEAEIQELNELFDRAKQKSIQYPDDSDFVVDLINIDSKRSERQKDLETLKQEVIKLAEDFARIPINTERLKKAKAYFENGEFAEARAVLNAEQMGTDLNTAIQREELGKALQEQAKEDRKNLANEYLILARLTATDFELPDRFEKAVEYFEQSLRADREVDHIFTYALFLHDHNQYSEAMFFYKEALGIYRLMAQSSPQIFLPSIAATLGNLADIHRAKNEIKQAEDAYAEVLNIYRSLAKVNPEHFLSDVALTLNKIGLLHNEKNEIEQAESKLAEALGMFRSLEESHPQAFLPHVAHTLNNLAILHNAKNERQQAEEEYTEVLDIYRALAQNYPYSFFPEIAATLNNLAILHRDKRNLTLAELEFTEATERYRFLSQRNPQIFLPDLAMSLTNLASLHSTKNELVKAQIEFEKALQIYRFLAQKDPEVFRPDLANTASNMALFYLNFKPDQEKSLKLAKEALNAAYPFNGYLKYVQDSIERARAVLRKWELDREEF